MSTEKIKREIEDIRFHIATLRTVYEVIDDPFIQAKYKTEIKTCLTHLKILKESYYDLLYIELKSAYPKADAIYEDKIVSVIGQDGLNYLIGALKIQLCACINGRRLYAI